MLPDHVHKLDNRNRSTAERRDGAAAARAFGRQLGWSVLLVGVAAAIAILAPGA